MARRNRAYYRDVRKRKIAHRKHICEDYYGWDWYLVDGRYSKGKIHCSCPLCSSKSKDRNWKHSDKQKIESAEDQLDSYFEREPAN